MEFKKDREPEYPSNAKVPKWLRILPSLVLASMLLTQKASAHETIPVSTRCLEEGNAWNLEPPAALIEINYRNRPLSKLVIRDEDQGKEISIGEWMDLSRGSGISMWGWPNNDEVDLLHTDGSYTLSWEYVDGNRETDITSARFQFSC